MSRARVLCATHRPRSATAYGLHDGSVVDRTDRGYSEGRRPLRRAQENRLTGLRHACRHAPCSAVDTAPSRHPASVPTGPPREQDIPWPTPPNSPLLHSRPRAKSPDLPSVPPLVVLHGRRRLEFSSTVPCTTRSSSLLPEPSPTLRHRRRLSLRSRRPGPRAPAGE